MIHVKGIDWQPIANMPADRKDGRRMLLWATDVDLAEVAEWEGSVWVSPGGFSCKGITHWADINPPA